ncbi:MAG TPA: hypothetical protein VGJ87_08135 [Roseiflexaceae bacterium]|jgi:hypothetical protein
MVQRLIARRNRPECFDHDLLAVVRETVQPFVGLWLREAPVHSTLDSARPR